MKKLLLIIALMLALPAFSQELQGGVTYDVNSARAYVQEGQEDTIFVGNNFYFDGVNAKDVDVMYVYNSNGTPNSFNVRYKDDLKRSYCYGMNNKLIDVAKYDKDSTIYPHRVYTYAPDGKLINTSLMISKGNGFVFTPKGKLVVRIVDHTGYLGNTNIIIGSQSNY